MIGSKISVLGMVIPPFIGNPYNGYINPYGTIGLMTIPYYMGIMEVWTLVHIHTESSIVDMSN